MAVNAEDLQGRDSGIPSRSCNWYWVLVPGLIYYCLTGKLWSDFRQSPLIGLQAAMPLKDMATSTATFGFIRYVPW